MGERDGIKPVGERGGIKPVGERGGIKPVSERDGIKHEKIYIKANKNWSILTNNNNVYIKFCA